VILSHTRYDAKEYSLPGAVHVKPSPSLLAAVRALLRPLVRLLMARGVTCPMLANLLKEIYVDVANREFAGDGGAPSDSRITLLTGVHRKDVRRLRAQPPAGPEEIPETVALGAQIVAAWTRRFRDAKGRPRPLARLQSQGGAESFEALVAGLSTDIRARAVLDAWLRLGVAELDDQDRVVLRSAAFVPSRGFAEKAFYFGHNVGDHLAAAAHNVLGGKPPFLERSVHYDSLDAASVEKLAALAEQGGMTALRAVNREAMQSEARDKKSDAPKQRITFGVYFFTAPRDAE
jgi:hypothetical protein